MDNIKQNEKSEVVDSNNNSKSKKSAKKDKTDKSDKVDKDDDILPNNNQEIKFIGQPNDDFWIKQYALLIEKAKIKIIPDKSDPQATKPWVLGMGGFGIVFMGQKTDYSKNQFAIKVIKLRELLDTNVNKEKMYKLICMAKNEMIISINFKHKNIIACLGVFEIEDYSRVIVSRINYNYYNNIIIFTILTYLILN